MGRTMPKPRRSRATVDQIVPKPGGSGRRGRSARRGTGTQYRGAALPASRRILDGRHRAGAGTSVDPRSGPADRRPLLGRLDHPALGVEAGADLVRGGEVPLGASDIERPDLLGDRLGDVVTGPDLEPDGV